MRRHASLNLLTGLGGSSSRPTSSGHRWASSANLNSMKLGSSSNPPCHQQTKHSKASSVFKVPQTGQTFRPPRENLRRTESESNGTSRRIIVPLLKVGIL